ncbi:MAG: hypothetical protein ACYC2G_10030 [Gemmatimonadaceae bacterium]
MTQLYYADASQTPVGPLSWAKLQELHAIGVVDGNTPVIEEGAAAWATYDGLERRRDTPNTYQPPPVSRNGINEHDRIREQMSAQTAQVGAHAAHAARVAGATANAFTGSVMDTMKRATTPAEKAVVFGCAAGLISFFLPWVSVFGNSVSGFFAAREISHWLWLFPVSLCVCFFLAYLNVSATPAQRVLRSRWLMLIGAFWSTVTLLPTIAGAQLGGTAGFGLWLALASMLGVTIGATMQVGENLRMVGGASNGDMRPEG